MLTARLSAYTAVLAVWVLMLATIGASPLRALAVLLLGGGFGACCGLVAASAPHQAAAADGAPGQQRDWLRRVALLALSLATNGAVVVLGLIVLVHTSSSP